MEFEFWILDFLQTLHHPLLDVLMKGASFLGNGGILWIILTIILLCIPKTRTAGMIMAVSLCADALLCNVLLKPAVARIRPYDVNTAVSLLIKAPIDYSFPSGHTAASFAAVSALYFADQKKLWKIFLIFAAVIAFSRMYLYVHYPTDILGGIVVGILSGYIGFWVINRIKKRSGN